MSYSSDSTGHSEQERSVTLRFPTENDATFLTFFSLSSTVILRLRSWRNKKKKVVFLFFFCQNNEEVKPMVRKLKGKKFLYCLYLL